jgi:hypothetical protein
MNMMLNRRAFIVGAGAIAASAALPVIPSAASQETVLTEWVINQRAYFTWWVFVPHGFYCPTRKAVLCGYDWLGEQAWEDKPIILRITRDARGSVLVSHPGRVQWYDRKREEFYSEFEGNNCLAWMIT